MSQIVTAACAKPYLAGAALQAGDLGRAQRRIQLSGRQPRAEQLLQPLLAPRHPVALLPVPVITILLCVQCVGIQKGIARLADTDASIDCAAQKLLLLLMLRCELEVRCMRRTIR